MLGAASAGRHATACALLDLLCRYHLSTEWVATGAKKGGKAVTLFTVASQEGLEESGAQAAPHLAKPLARRQRSRLCHAHQLQREVTLDVCVGGARVCPGPGAACTGSRATRYEPPRSCLCL